MIQHFIKCSPCNLSSQRRHCFLTGTVTWAYRVVSPPEASASVSVKWGQFYPVSNPTLLLWESKETIFAKRICKLKRTSWKKKGRMERGEGHCFCSLNLVALNPEPAWSPETRKACLPHAQPWRNYYNIYTVQVRPEKYAQTDVQLTVLAERALQCVAGSKEENDWKSVTPTHVEWQGLVASNGWWRLPHGEPFVMPWGDPHPSLFAVKHPGPPVSRVTLNKFLRAPGLLPDLQGWASALDEGWAQTH